ncbi:MAG: hypothetical protein E7354_01845 [Clostridiales bacterium]|nr:hypothetical protein [Clostridiales bacterium]
MAVIEDPLKYLVPIWIALIILVLLFKFNNWVDSKPAKKETKSKSNKEETIKKVDQASEDSLALKKKEEAKVEEPVPDIVVNTNYLYDRFVDNPTVDDNYDCDNKRKDIFLSDEESESIKNKKIQIKVQPVEELSEKELLYKKIEAMTSENMTAREKLLEEFDALPRNTKLMLIENIIQRMN